MKNSRWLLSPLLPLAIGLLSSAAAAQDAVRVVQPGAPGEANRIRTTEDIVQDTGPMHTAADVEFMQGMIGHHAQALEMTALVPSRTTRQDITLLARRIELSQNDEMTLMRRWLEERGESVPMVMGSTREAHAMGHHSTMPGMLSPEEIARLAGASGAEFDRLFLEYMIRHHAGAQTMVATLFATPGSGQEAEIFNVAAHIDADQGIEIARMEAMLASSR